MADIAERLRKAVDIWRDIHDRALLLKTANAMLEAADEINTLRDLIEVLIYNDPNERMPDSETVLDVWRKQARAALKNHSSLVSDSDHG